MTDSEMSAFAVTFVSFFGVFSVILIALLVLAIIAEWKIFKKAGQKGWEAIVPFYNSYTSYKIYWGNGWLFLVPTLCMFLAGIIPVVGVIFSIAAFVVTVMTQYKKAEAFGERIGFTIGLVFLPTIFDMILAFGHYEYHGIPMDGVSYKDIKNKYDDIKTRPVDYEKPVEPEAKPMDYEQPVEPEVKPMEYEQPIAAPVAEQVAEPETAPEIKPEINDEPYEAESVIEPAEEEMPAKKESTTIKLNGKTIE